MRKLVLCLCFAAFAASAEVHTLTLPQVVERALEQNPDVIMARLDERRAAQQIRIAKDPFIPKVYVGSGLAATYGFPLSIEGSAPSIVEARAIAAVFNQPARHRLKQTREEAKGAAMEVESQRDSVAMRTVELFLEAERAAKAVKSVSAQVEGLERIATAMRARVDEGRELPLALKQAQLDVAIARQRTEIFETDLEHSESLLASVLGYEPGDKVRAVTEPRRPLGLPGSEDAVVAQALDDNLSIRRLESSLVAKGHQLSAEKDSWKPTVNLVGKYGLFAKFNNYDEFFNRFQRHNGLIGISVDLPVYAGRASRARETQASLDIERLRTELNSARSRIALDAKRRYQEVRRAETGVEVARMDLDVTREQLSVLLAKMEEGRASLREVEAVRYIENEKWIAFYDAHHALQLARYRLLDETGGLLAALR